MCGRREDGLLNGELVKGVGELIGQGGILEPEIVKDRLARAGGENASFKGVEVTAKWCSKFIEFLTEEFDIHQRHYC